ncbi:hypothetical protein LCGC14_0142010 [marine sediment metagenome]|uniref:Uncharacterized protein n=1 Tax=marine sediment metagenome TaxID=412755 RepID=A0A0F9XIE2_9ZZZZ
MSPIDYIKQGITKGSWEDVCQGYSLLTGISLPVPQIEEFIGTFSAEEALANIGAIVSNTSIRKTTNPEKKKSGRPKGSGKKKKKTKEVEDDSILTDDNTHFITNSPDPEEIEKNKQKAMKTRNNKTRVKRPPATIYKATCSECTEFFNSDRPNGEIGQKCPKCLKGTKGRLNG